MRRTAQLLGLVLLFVGCSDSPTSAQDQDLATLRRVTTPFQTFSAATAAGWSAKITSCMSSAAGGMGFHYGNTALIDGTARVDQPELLLYEPQADNSLKLVAVEYIIPYTAHAKSDTAPVLFGQRFKQNDAFQLWGLHVWLWKNNPTGLYADWNPDVTCANTTDVASMSH
jgi:hypothetical protein